MKDSDQTCPKWLSRFALLFAYLAFALYTHTLDRVLSGNSNNFTSATSSSLVQGLALLSLYAGVLGHIILGRPKRFGAAALATVLVVLLCVASTTWSADPALTFRRSVSIAGVLLTFSFIYRALGGAKLWQVFVYFAGGFVVVQTLLMIGAPGYAFHTLIDIDVAEHAGRFRGVFAHKNEAARIGLTMLLVLAVGRSEFGGWVWLGLMACAASTLIATESAKVYAALAGALVVYWGVRLPLSGGAKLLFAGIIGAILGTVMLVIDVPAMIATVSKGLGRDATFSGRDVVWRLAWENIALHPWFGGGFYAGWPQSAKDFLLQLKGPTGSLNHAHNGYLQLVLDIGVIGLALALVPSLLALNNIASKPVGHWTDLERFGAVFIPAYFILNTAGSYLLVTNDLFQWLVLFLAMESQRSVGAAQTAASTGTDRYPAGRNISDATRPGAIGKAVPGTTDTADVVKTAPSV